MSEQNKHGKALTSFDDAILTLMMKTEEGERYLQRNMCESRYIIVTDCEEENYPAFQMNERKEKEPLNGEAAALIEHMNLWENHQYAKSHQNTIKLTVWEWLEARKKGIGTFSLIFGVCFLQIYITWSAGLSKLSLLILKGMEYSCLFLLICKLVRWIISGEMHRYLNENC